MLPSPLVVWGKGDQPGDEAEGVVCLLRCEKGTVTAIVKDNEGSHEYESGEGREENRDPPSGGGSDFAGLHGCLKKIKPDPDSEKGSHRIENLPPGSPGMGLLKVSN